MNHWLGAAPLLLLACAHTATAPSSEPEPTTPVSDEARLGRMAYVLGCPREQVTGQEHEGAILAEGCDRLAVFQTREDGSLGLQGSAIRRGTDDAVPYHPALGRLRKVWGKFPSPVPLIDLGIKRGSFQGRCKINRQGVTSQCRVIQSFPEMDATILEALKTWRFDPVLHKGEPVAVDYLFKIQMHIP